MTRFAACAVLLVATATARADEEYTLIAPQEPCRPAAGAAWTLRGQVPLRTMLRALSDLSCSTFMVPKSLLATKFNADVSSGNWTPAEGVLRVLRAQGLDLPFEQLYLVRRAAEVPRLVQCVENRCSLSRDLVTRLMTPSFAFPRMLPITHDGRVVGAKLYAIRPGSLFGQLGFANGDILRSVDSVAFSAESLLGFVTALQRPGSVKVEIERAGKVVTREYTVD
jgi:hypothetical protein